MSTIITIIAAVAVFCLLILSHELGHFLAARACGVYVEDFSLGMGPKLFGWKGKQTNYSLRLLPIGGWCRMLGEEDDSNDKRAFCNKTVWQRILIVFAGPLANFLFAIIIFIVIFMMIGTYSETSELGEIQPDSPAAAAGLESGDVILSINGEEISQWTEIGAAVNAYGGEALTLLVDRDGEQLTLTLSPAFNAEDQSWKIGVTPAKERQNIFTAIGLGVQQSIFFTKELILGVAGMIAGTVDVDVAGPVGIVNTIGDAAGYGLQTLLLLMGYLCINLAIVNLLPLPALDGSRIVFLLIEWIRGKAIAPEKENRIHFIGLVLLMGLMVLITYRDIVNLVVAG